MNRSFIQIAACNLSQHFLIAWQVMQLKTTRKSMEDPGHVKELMVYQAGKHTRYGNNLHILLDFWPIYKGLSLCAMTEDILTPLNQFSDPRFTFLIKRPFIQVLASLFLSLAGIKN